MSREEKMGALFDRIDAIVTKDGTASKEELTAVFGEHAEEFLKFCDADSDKKLTKEEFVNGIVADAKEMSDDDFNTNWVERMNGVVAAAEAGKPASGADQFNWPPLESDPETFADFATKLGMQEYTTGEVFSFDPEMLAFLPFSGPPSAVILCMRRMPEKGAEDKQRGDLSTPCRFYMDQTGQLDNACGVIALIHSILNNDVPLKEGSPLAQFRDANLGADPAARATSLENFTAIHDLYKITAEVGNQENADGVHMHKDAEGNEVAKTFHFVAYIRNEKGQVVELDGTKKGPWVVAENATAENFMELVGKEKDRRVAEGEIDQGAMAVMALGPV